MLENSLEMPLTTKNDTEKDRLMDSQSHSDTPAISQPQNANVSPKKPTSTIPSRLSYAGFALAALIGGMFLLHYLQKKIISDCEQRMDNCLDHFNTTARDDVDYFCDDWSPEFPDHSPLAALWKKCFANPAEFGVANESDLPEKFILVVFGMAITAVFLLLKSTIAYESWTFKNCKTMLFPSQGDGNDYVALDNNPDRDPRSATHP